MKEEYYRMLLNPRTKDVANKAIHTELIRITDDSNIVTFSTDPKENSFTKYIRTTVFVHDTSIVNFRYLKRVEENLKKLFRAKFKILFCNANLTNNESLLLSSISSTNVISFVDLENFVSSKSSDEEKITTVKNLILKTLAFTKDDSIVICANKNLVSLARKTLDKFKDNKNIIMIETIGKDCSDLRLVQSIQMLYDLKKIDSSNRVNIVSGDGFFDSIIQWLDNRDLNLSVFGQNGKTHHKLMKHKNFVALNDYNLAS